ncbi:NHL repeat-containing protein [Vulgatibacter incomptus]|uniref:Cell surface protein n=1 Tax=Vulgatibacter incomptus TaxID=1391653 RepID=A0A0K1PEL2_9BACT|nr:NHL repeat-containing protein [Vulgatibacter incomptus]AKU91973.1 Cell surface protein [Vulgatibacter incomptus]
MQRRSFIGLALAGGAAALLPRAIGTWREAGAVDLVAGPDHLSFDARGNAYRIDPVRNQLSRLDGANDWVRGGTGIREGELNGPTALAFDARQRIHVADAGNGRIQVFEKDGSVSHVIGRPGTGEGELALPRGLAFDDAGRLYVCDTLNHRIQIFDGTRPAGTIGAFGLGPSELNGPRSLAFAPDGLLHVVDAGNRRIQVFDTEGRWIDGYDGGEARLAMPGSIAFGPNGRAYVGDAAQGTVAVFSRGRPVDRFVPTDEAGHAVSPLHLAFDSQGRLRVAGPAAPSLS